MRVLALDASCGRCSAAVMAAGAVLAARQVEGARGHAAVLPVLVRDVLAEAACAPTTLDLIAVTLGPGGFTGLRAALALAHGIALAAGVKLVGVSVGEAFAEALPQLGRRTLWTAIDSRRERIFLERDGTITATPLDALPRPDVPVAVAGDAAITVAARLAARDLDVMLTNVRLPMARHVALAAMRLVAEGRPLRDPLPIYVDPPEARLPAGGLRPAPVDHPGRD